jgi:hypothetical protein
MTDIATGWTECLTMPFRNHAFVIEHVQPIHSALPFPLRGLDSDNDTASMNEEVFDYCKNAGIELTRCRSYKKNDQAWVEQKNGSMCEGSWATAGCAAWMRRKHWRLFVASRACTSTFSSLRSS